MTRRNWVWALAIGAVLTGCTSEKAPVEVPVEWNALRGDAIPAATRDAVHAANERLLKCIETKDAPGALSLFAKAMQEQEGFAGQVESMLNQFAQLLGTTEFSPGYECYVSFTPESGSAAAISVPSGAEPPFTVDLPPVPGDKFVSLLESENGTLVALIYALQDGEWSIAKMHAGIMRMGGKTAPEWVDEARDLLAANKLFPANFRMQFAAQCIEPAPFIRFDGIAAMQALAQDVVGRLDTTYAFPHAVDGVAGVQQLYRLDAQASRGGLVLLVGHVTAVSLDDEAALRTQCEALLPKMQELYPGLTEGFNQALFTIFAEPPTDRAKTYDTKQIVLPLGEE
ncbi:MAG: hypothetical protein GY851_02125 [bacterium]|nr:hypothetical protein [bacterium]